MNDSWYERKVLDAVEKYHKDLHQSLARIRRDLDPYHNLPSQTVIIDVRGGVAEVAECPPNVTVEIRDYDNCEAGSGDDYCDED